MSSPAEKLRALVESWLRPRLDYLALYPCTVVAQRADKTLDLQPDDERVPPCASVPIRHGLPGVTVTVPAGGRVLLGYAGGNPALPYVSLWESGSVTAISINAGTAKAAREGDDVTAAGVPTPPAGMRGWMAQVTAAVNGLVPLSVSAPPTVLGTISEGSDALRLP